MKIMNLNINDFGGTANHREEYKKNFNNKYLVEWDKLNKSHNVDGIFQYIEGLNSKPDIIVLQEFDINSKEATYFNLTARNSPTSKVAGCKGFGLVQGLAPCA